MARKLEKAKSAALDTLIEQGVLDRQDRNKGIISKDKIEKDSWIVKQRYDLYIEARDMFKVARMNLVKAKTSLQLALEPGIIKKISKSKHWDFDIDPKGNVRYRDDDKDFEKKYKNFVARYNKEKEDLASYDDTDIFFDVKDNPKSAEDLETAEVSKDTSAGTAEGTDDGPKAATIPFKAAR